MILLDSSYDSWENEVLFLKIEAKVVDLWFDVFWAQVIQMYFLGPRPQRQEIFWDFIILLDSSYDSWENQVLFVKIGARVLD